MKNSLYDRIWRREAGQASHFSSIRGIYGSKEWMDNLDIVNELGGHTGCVNALCWSRSGQLLASGSDDRHLNIYSYQPDSSTSPFSLNTTVFTGHKANIFNVKFMPHSNDRTLVTCAGDHQVRVFDIEYSSSNSNVAATSALSSSARSSHSNNFFNNTRYLSEGNTNARVYRSHADRVKRIVTESSPYLFLSCSEDGEVRQWDLRQPSSAYPAPRGGQGPLAYRPGVVHDSSNTPPPLISYKRHHLDINAMSCSPTQPHYIALGGAHLHCFLHDRRMAGRDLLVEAGDPGGSARSNSRRDDELMGQATRCVRRFAPNGKRRMSPRGTGDITSCKISDANPNEMVVSWSGDYIYSFDLIRSPDARDADPSRQNTVQGKPDARRRRDSKNKKRKRPTETSIRSHTSDRLSRSRRRFEGDGDDGELAFRVRYGNGEMEDIPLPSLSEAISDSPTDLLEQARDSVLSEAQRLSMRIAKGLVNLRKALFSLGASLRETPEPLSAPDLSPYQESFSSALTEASAYLPQMDEIMRNWGYPLNPTPDVVGVQQSLRHNRESAWRFVQAAGTLARILGGEVSGDQDVALDQFQEVMMAPGEGNSIDRGAQFGYDFIKAVLLWIEGGRDALLAGFKRDSAHRRNRARFPLSETADDTAIETVLIPYLQGLASDTPVVNVDASRFELDSTRIICPTQHGIVTAFGNAVKLALVDLENGSDNSPSTPHVRALNRSVATRFWAFKICRGILMEAGSGVNYELVNRAFGGLRTMVEDEVENRAAPERSQDDIDPDVEEERIRDVNLTTTGDSSAQRTLIPEQSKHEVNGSLEAEESSLHFDEQASDGSFFEWHTGNTDSDAASMNGDGGDGEGEGGLDNDEREEDDVDGTSDEYELSAGEDSSRETDDAFEAEDRIFRQYGVRRTRREDVNLDVPCSSHTRVYRGHCNIKTNKDVSFFGLNDEYVMSGSDSGHVFIWDRKTSELVNILEADSDVVNVVQGHPYEPTFAASGMDNTIKIFSPDSRAQEDAARGRNILDPDNAANKLGPRVSGIGGLKSRKCIQDSYQIMSQNDVERQGGMDEAYITREMLARLAVSLRRQQTAGGTENATFVLEDNCNVM